MIENLRYTGINLSWLIQGVAMNEKIHLCGSSKTKYFKDNVKTAHWVSHSQLRSLDTDYLLTKNRLVELEIQ